MVMQIAERDDRSAASYLLRLLFIKPWASQLTKITTRHEQGSPRLKPPFLVRHKCDVSERQVESIYLYDITLKTTTPTPTPTPATHPRRPKRIYYIAGGSWQAPPNDTHWKFLSEMLQRLDQPATVTLISCPLAPTSPAEVTYPLLTKLYHALSADGAFEKEDVSFAGDSSGGNVVLAWVMQSFATPHDPTSGAPARLVLICPSVDLSHEHPDLEAAAKHDPLESVQMVKETAKAWARDWALTDPRLSPALGDIAVLADHGVAVYGIIAGHDVLSVEAREFMKHCVGVGVEGRFLVWDRQLHDFPIMAPYGFPESVKALEWIALALNQGQSRGEDTKRSFEHLESESLKSFTRHVLPSKLSVGK